MPSRNPFFLEDIDSEPMSRRDLAAAGVLAVGLGTVFASLSLLSSERLIKQPNIRLAYQEIEHLFDKNIISRKQWDAADIEGQLALLLEGKAQDLSNPADLQELLQHPMNAIRILAAIRLAELGSPKPDSQLEKETMNLFRYIFQEEVQFNSELDIESTAALRKPRRELQLEAQEIANTIHEGGIEGLKSVQVDMLPFGKQAFEALANFATEENGGLHLLGRGLYFEISYREAAAALKEASPTHAAELAEDSNIPQKARQELRR